jgi:tRNA pseudouridine13 synthase
MFQKNFKNTKKMYKIKQSPEDFIVNEIPNRVWDKKGSYTIYNLKKKNYTTEKAVTIIAEYLKIPRKLIGYAGNKDKLAITTQYISIKGSSDDGFDLKDISLKKVGYSDQPISLGDLKGNEFKINVQTELKPKPIKKIVNYFGEQRFSKNNTEIGYLLLKKKFKESVELILKHELEFGPTIKDYIDKKPNDYIGALRKIPIKILKLYIHSYQSKLWNEIAKIKSKNKQNEKLPIIGFTTDLNKDVEEIIKKENISTRDFIFHQIPELSQEGNQRDLFAEIRNLKIKKIEKGYNLSFELDKGAYATEVIKQIFS